MIKPFSIDLSVDVGGLKLRNPVMPASGCFSSANKWSVMAWRRSSASAHARTR